MSDGIKLEPHPAHKFIHGVRVQMVKDQYQVMVNGVRVAYCSVAADGPISFIHRYPPDFMETVVASVNEQRGGIASGVFQPPAVIEQPEYDEDETDTEEE